MTEQYLIELIRKDIMKVISEDEKAQLTHWRSSDSKQDTLARDIYRAWDISGSYGEDIEIDYDADYQRLLDKIDSSPSTQSNIIQLKWLVSIAAGLLLLMVAWLTITESGASHPDTVIIATATTDGEVLVLPDKSEVMMRRGAVLTYDSTFQLGRNITFKGEAYFKITTDAQRPFVITSPRLRTEVLGTEFFLIDGQHDSQSSVRLIEGQVRVQSTQNSSSKILAPMQSADYLNGALTQRRFTLSEEETKWYQPTVNFIDEPLHEVALHLTQLTGINILIPSTIEDCKFSASLKINDLNQILSAIATLYNAKLHKEGSGYKLVGGLCV